MRDSQIATLVGYCGYVVGFVYLKAHVTNLVWNGVVLGPVRFRSRLLFRELAFLYVTNALAILGSVGLLVPWAMIRTTKYRASRMDVLVDGSLEEFEGSAESTVSAAGAEVGELFDLGVAL